MLAFVDWAIIAAYFALTFWIGLRFSKKSGQNLSEFFLGGREFGWGLAGLSLVATTFAADTPLAVTELVRKNGVAGNWIWWSMLAGGMVTAFFFARYWRRAEVLTDVEFIALRYSGAPARFLRGFKALYFGLLMNTIIIGWVNLAMASVLEIFLGLSRVESLLLVGLCMVGIAVYAGRSGLRGVTFTDAFQFIFAMVGCIVLAVIVVNEVGGLGALTAFFSHNEALRFFPTIGGGAKTSGGYALDGLTFFTFIGVQWWASWYPGAEPGGGGYVAQRLMSTRSEKDALWAMLLFQGLHIAARPWPWIIVGLASFILYPNLTEGQYKYAYIMSMRDYLPIGLKGLLLASFLAAYMSTIATHLNWGVSYIINDFYKPFIKPDAAEKDYVTVSRWATAAVVVLGTAGSFMLESIEGAWVFLIECGAGAGLPLILRWYWGRVSAYSEISAMVAPFIGFTACKLAFWYIDDSAADSFFRYPNSYLLTVAFTTISWLIITYLTPPTDAHVLQTFYDKVRPQGVWKKYARVHSDKTVPTYILALGWFGATAFIYALLFLIGGLLFGRYIESAICSGVALVSWTLLFQLNRRYSIFE